MAGSYSPQEAMVVAAGLAGVRVVRDRDRGLGQTKIPDVADLDETLKQVLRRLSSPGLVQEKSTRRVFRTANENVRLLNPNQARVFYSVFNATSGTVHIRTSDETAETEFAFQLLANQLYESPSNDPHPYTGPIRIYFGASVVAGEAVHVTERVWFDQ